MLLALDVSSSCIGWAVFNGPSPLFSGYIAIPTCPSELILLLTIRSLLLSFFSELTAEKIILKNIIIEECLQHMPSRSSAKTITKLFLVNKFVSLVCFDETGILPEYASVSSVRAFLRRKFGQKDLKKEDIPGILAANYNLPFLSEVMLSSTKKRKNQGNRYS